MLNEKLKVDLPLSDDIVAPRAMDVYPKCPLLIPALLKNSQEVRDAFRSAWIGIFGRRKSTQMDGGGEWKSGLWAHLRSERRIQPQFLAAGAHPMEP